MRARSVLWVVTSLLVALALAALGWAVLRPAAAAVAPVPAPISVPAAPTDGRPPGSAPTRPADGTPRTSAPGSDVVLPPPIDDDGDDGGSGDVGEDRED